MATFPPSVRGTGPMNLQTYTLILRLLLPFVLLRLYWRSLKAPAYRRRILERLVRDAPPAAPAAVWVHVRPKSVERYTAGAAAMSPPA